MAFVQLKTLKIAKRTMPWGTDEYRIEDLGGLAITDWQSSARLDALRAQAQEIEGLRDGSVEPGNRIGESY